MKVHILSLGCARTLVDSEGLGGILASSGHRITDDIVSAECVVINTCAFIREAEEESISTILQVVDLKKKGTLRRLYVAGCLPQKRRGERADLLKLLPEVDGFLGPGDLPKLPELMLQQEAVIASPEGAKQSRFFVTSPVPTLLFESKTPRHRLTANHFAYLKISEGCDHACSFCSIPQFRGAHRSRSMEDLAEEAAQRISEGAVELNLIGQDASCYGADRYGSPKLPELLRRLSDVPGVRWIRILYAHPAHVTDELVKALRDCPPVVKYLDIPLQHISDPLLSAMRRETDGDTIRRLVDQFRREVPGIALRTTFIVGFPGETEAQVDELAQFMKEARFERLGIFAYSPEPKTPSERMPNQIPEEVKQERLHRLMSLQQEIAREVNEQFLGRELEVLVEELAESPVHPEPFGPAQDRPVEGPTPYLTLGRTYADAPEVDGQVFLRSAQPLQPGQLIQAKVIDTYEYDLVAEAIA